MKNFEFKSALNKLKEEKNKDSSENGKNFVKFGDVMKEKIKENKVKPSLIRNFEEMERERGEWNKIRNTTLNKEKEETCSNTEKIPSKDTTPIQSNSDSIEILNLTKTTESKDFLEESMENKQTKVQNLEEEINDVELALREPTVIEADKIDTKIKKNEWVNTVDPKAIISEITEDKRIIRVIYADNYTFDYKCTELYSWFHIMFIHWEKELELIPQTLRDGAECRYKYGVYKQCRGYIKPLLRMLKKKEVLKEVCNKLFEIMIFCMDKDYIRAHDKYIELAIGNAPWPMGVTMVGIHERTGRARIAKSQVANILNDENTKKYLQSVKRIMSLVQRIYPTSPSLSIFS